jgi:SnoaL-like domain
MAKSTARRVADAMQAADFEAMRDLLAPEVVLNSPITSSIQFRGRDNILELLRIVHDAYEDLTYTDIFGRGDTWAQVFDVRVNGTPMQGTDLIRLDEEGRVREFTVFFRPLSGVATLASALAPEVARRQGSRPRSAVARAMTRPLAAATRAGDRIAGRLAGGGNFPRRP